jgi:hypothetical protein
MAVDIPSEIQKAGGELRPLTLIIPSANFNERTEYPGRVEITLEVALWHGDRVSQAGLHPETYDFVCLVFKDIQFSRENLVEEVRRGGLGVRHFFGRIDMTLKLMSMGVPIVWKYPEAGLHPSCCCELGDVAIKLAKSGQCGRG